MSLGMCAIPKSDTSLSGETQWRKWVLQGLEVTQIRFDHSTHIHAWSQERDLLLILGSPFALQTVDGPAVRLAPEQSESLCPLLSLLFRPLTDFRVSSAGECRLTFADGD